MGDLNGPRVSSRFCCCMVGRASLAITSRCWRFWPASAARSLPTIRSASGALTARLIRRCGRWRCSWMSWAHAAPGMAKQAAMLAQALTPAHAAAAGRGTRAQSPAGRSG